MNNFLFIHVPKVGGNYIGAALRGINYTGNHFVYMNKSEMLNFPPIPFYRKVWFQFAEESIEEVYKHKIVFGSVRNPFDWLVSCWHVVPDGEGITSFDYFLKTIAEKQETWPSKKFLFFPFFSSSGEFLLDIVVHQDDLDTDLNWMCQKFPELSNIKLDRIKVSENRKYLDYREYYTTDRIDIVQKTWNRELYLFGYDFEGRTKGVLNRTVPVHIKNNLNYKWETDKLIINGEEYL